MLILNNLVLIICFTILIASYKNELNINARFYDLRGTYATRLTNNGTLMNEVSELMGHSDPSITRKYYISTTEDNKREAINNLDKVNNSDVINNAIKFEV